MEKMSYAMGINVGEYVLKSPLPVKPELVLEGLKDCLAGAPGLPPEEYAKAMHELQAQMQQAGQDQMKKMAEGNSKAGKEFLEANAKKRRRQSHGKRFAVSGHHGRFGSQTVKRPEGPRALHGQAPRRHRIRQLRRARAACRIHADAGHPRLDRGASAHE